jgi:hypothetical protein
MAKSIRSKSKIAMRRRKRLDPTSQFLIQHEARIERLAQKLHGDRMQTEHSTADNTDVIIGSDEDEGSFYMDKSPFVNNRHHAKKLKKTRVRCNRGRV